MRMLFSFLWVIPRGLKFVPTFRNTLSHLHMPYEHDSPKRNILLTRTMKMEQSFPKRGHLKCRRRGIAQKKETQHVADALRV